jgi:type IV pilus assembly protein PilC
MPVTEERSRTPKDIDDEDPSDWSEEAPTVIAPMPGWKAEEAGSSPGKVQLAAAAAAMTGVDATGSSPAPGGKPDPAPASPAAVSAPDSAAGPAIGHDAPSDPLEAKAAAMAAAAAARHPAGTPAGPAVPKKLQALFEAADQAVSTKPKSRAPGDDDGLNAKRAHLESLLVRPPKPAKLSKAQPLAARYNLRLPAFLQGVTEKELAIFTRQLATMVNSGLPLLQCLQVQASQATNPVFKGQLESVKRLVESGSTFSDALRRHPSTFDSLYVSLVSAGETGGVLDIILTRLAVYIEKAADLKKQIKIAMVYPTAILIVAVVVIALLVLKVVPVFERMFAGFGQTLPAQTRLAIELSNFVQDHFILIAAGVAGAFAGLASFYRSPRGRTVIDTFLIRAPLIGDLLVKVAVARFCRTLGTMITSGVPILQALEICTETAGNKVVEKAIATARRAVSEGKPLAKPMQTSGVFPEMVCQMITVGESTGSLDTMLSKIADFYEDEVEASVSAMAALIEPAMMVFLGVVIGGLLIAMYMPIFSISSVVGGGG